jgi:hypothetical protein
MIRLGCIYCDQDHDDITSSQLRALKKAGWKYVARTQTYKQSIRSVKPEEANDVVSVLDWQTHLGVCPRCGVHYT